VVIKGKPSKGKDLDQNQIRGEIITQSFKIGTVIGSGKYQKRQKRYHVRGSGRLFGGPGADDRLETK